MAVRCLLIVGKSTQEVGMIAKERGVGPWGGGLDAPWLPGYGPLSE